MRDDTFLSKTVKFIGTVLTIGGLISQYLLRDEFRKVLSIPGEGSNYDAFTLAGLILSLIIIAGLYGFRYSLLNRVYINWEAYRKYLNSSRVSLTQTPQADSKPQVEIIREPFYIDGKRLAIFAVVIATVSFIFIFILYNPLHKSISYLLFLLFSVIAATVFLLIIYLEEEWKSKEKQTRELILSKLREHFSPPISVVEKLEDTSNLLYPTTKMIVKIKRKEYFVQIDKNNPEAYFSILPYKRKQNNEK